MYNEQSIINYIINQQTKAYTGFDVEPLSVQVEINELSVIHPVILQETHELQEVNYMEVSTSLNLGNSLLVLTQNDVDIPITAVLTLESAGNVFSVTRAEYLSMNHNKNQVFENFLKVSLKNYGEFIPFQLEFLKIIPHSS